MLINHADVLQDRRVLGIALTDRHTRSDSPQSTNSSFCHNFRQDTGYRQLVRKPPASVLDQVIRRGLVFGSRGDLTSGESASTRLGNTMLRT